MRLHGAGGEGIGRGKGARGTFINESCSAKKRSFTTRLTVRLGGGGRMDAREGRANAIQGRRRNYALEKRTPFRIVFERFTRKRLELGRITITVNYT